MVRAEPKRFSLDRANGNWPFPQKPSMIALSTPAGALIRWDLRSGKPPVPSVGHSYSGFSESPDRKFLAAVRDSNTLELFAVPSDIERPIDEHSLATWRSCEVMEIHGFSPDSKSLVVLDKTNVAGEERPEATVVLISVPTLERMESMPFQYARSPKYSPDGRRLAFATPDELILWDILEQKVVWKIFQPYVIRTVFSPDGTLIAMATSDRQVTIRNTVDGTTRIQLTNHRSVIQAMAFSADNRTLVTATSLGFLKFSHVATGQELLEFQHIDSVVRLEFEEGGRYLVCQLRHRGAETPDEILIFDASDRLGGINDSPPTQRERDPVRDRNSAENVKGNVQP